MFLISLSPPPILSMSIIPSFILYLDSMCICRIVQSFLWSLLINLVDNCLPSSLYIWYISFPFNLISSFSTPIVALAMSKAYLEFLSDLPATEGRHSDSSRGFGGRSLPIFFFLPHGVTRGINLHKGFFFLLQNLQHYSNSDYGPHPDGPAARHSGPTAPTWGP